MQLAMSGLGVLIMAALCGLSLFFIVADLRRGHEGGTAQPTSPLMPPEVGSQAADPQPLTLDEVFPQSAIEPIAGAASYRILMTNIDSDCDIAAAGTLGRLLDDHGCTQVARAAMATPYAGYQATAGIFNLADEQQSRLVSDSVGRRLDAGDGSFGVLSTGLPGVEPGRPPLSQAAWHDHGHYLVYCVITRPDGRPILDDDPDAERIIDDLVESYLGGTVLGRRTSNP